MRMIAHRTTTRCASRDHATRNDVHRREGERGRGARWEGEREGGGAQSCASPHVARSRIARHASRTPCARRAGPAPARAEPSKPPSSLASGTTREAHPPIRARLVVTRRDPAASRLANTQSRCATARAEPRRTTPRFGVPSTTRRTARLAPAAPSRARHLHVEQAQLRLVRDEQVLY